MIIPKRCSDCIKSLMSRDVQLFLNRKGDKDFTKFTRMILCAFVVKKLADAIFSL